MKLTSRPSMSPSLLASIEARLDANLDYLIDAGRYSAGMGIHEIVTGVLIGMNVPYFMVETLSYNDPQNIVVLVLISSTPITPDEACESLTFYVPKWRG